MPANFILLTHLVSITLEYEQADQGQTVKITF
jgi:hypothetical protein